MKIDYCSLTGLVTTSLIHHEFKGYPSLINISVKQEAFYCLKTFEVLPQNGLEHEKCFIDMGGAKHAVGY
jgi:hypothetical protein